MIFFKEAIHFQVHSTTCPTCENHIFVLIVNTLVVMGVTMAQIFFKPEKNLEFFRLKICAIDDSPGRLE